MASVRSFMLWFLHKNKMLVYVAEFLFFFVCINFIVTKKMSIQTDMSCLNVSKVGKMCMLFITLLVS